VTLHPDSQGKLGWYRGRQKGLLGEALLVVPEDEEVAARTLARLALDADERARRAAIGRERMGEPGGAARMAAWLANQL
ncbi:MAG: sugar synthetase, partial [Candidatus Eremiobacteraeota bacterium]|nr:sugar synthetase [Candidatus Eremiobacteraeota bacterium]